MKTASVLLVGDCMRWSNSSTSSRKVLCCLLHFLDVSGLQHCSFLFPLRSPGLQDTSACTSSDKGEKINIYIK